MKIQQMIISLMMAMMVMVNSGCAEKQPPKPQYVYLPVPINRPDRPVFPRIKGSDLSCLSNDVRLQLLRRDDIMKTYMNMLEATIDATKVNETTNP